MCSVYFKEWDINLNPKKSKLMYFGKKRENLFQPTLNGTPLEQVRQWKYLGMDLTSHKKFDCSILNRVKKFYKSLNSILRIEGRSDEMTLLRLIESHCLPILTYAIEVLEIADVSDRRKLRVAYNSIFRKLFGYRQYESVRQLQKFLGRNTWEELLEDRKSKFNKKN